MRGDHAALARLNDALRHEFEDPSLLEEALTHSSAAAHADTPTYERLEFLGDRVLGLVIAERLFDCFPDEPEGDLARRHASLVSRRTLVRVAEALELGACLTMPKGETQAGTRRRPTILADACEALIGALYMDAGLDAARDFILRHWDPFIELPMPMEAKTMLQEWAQARGKSLPRYRVVATEGPPHDPVFTVELTVDGQAPVRATGGSKRIAEREAARRLLETLDAAAVSVDDD